jgi:hypothetical protein
LTFQLTMIRLQLGSIQPFVSTVDSVETSSDLALKYSVGYSI